MGISGYQGPPPRNGRKAKPGMQNPSKINKKTVVTIVRESYDLINIYPKSTPFILLTKSFNQNKRSLPNSKLSQLVNKPLDQVIFSELDIKDKLSTHIFKKKPLKIISRKK